MSIFVEKSLFQLSSNVLNLFSCHHKLPYSALATQESQGKVYLFQEVFLVAVIFHHSKLLILFETLG